VLHVTNGDSAAELIRDADLGGEILPWRDVLHEGPVPAGLDLRELSRVRAGFLAEQGWGDPSWIHASFAGRDASLDAWADHDEVVLWFEHDLYDQLQLAQVLDHLGRGPAAATARLRLICIDRHPGIERFLGLGQLSPRSIASLFPGRQEVSTDQLELARTSWAAFRDPSPRAIERLLAGDTSALPFLAAALRRHLEQFPSVRNGLGRTEQRALEALSTGPRAAVDLFRHDLECEESPFLGDHTFFGYLRQAARARRPLVEIAPAGEGSSMSTSVVTLTDDGRAVLAGELDAIGLNGVDRWWGGVHQCGTEAPWRWDESAGRLSGP
jgi:hypothetical protein